MDAPAGTPLQRVDRKIRLIELGPVEGHKHTASVLLMHGFGDTAAGWYDAAMYWAERLPHVRFILPTAPVSVPMGGVPSWFDLGNGARRKKTWSQSIETLSVLLDREVSLVGASNVVVIGFSQGGALAYDLGMSRMTGHLGGIVGLSTFYPKPKIEEARMSVVDNVALKKTPILICHGDADDRIPGGLAAVSQTKTELEEMGCSAVDLKVYSGMGHSACQQEVRDILLWLHQVALPPRQQSRGENRASRL